jgi:hypothetical protein
MKVVVLQKKTGHAIGPVSRPTSAILASPRTNPPSAVVVFSMSEPIDVQITMGPSTAGDALFHFEPMPQEVSRGCSNLQVIEVLRPEILT